LIFAFGWKSTYQSKILKFNVSFALVGGFFPVATAMVVVLVVSLWQAWKAYCLLCM
jgi:hypothetical protein